MEHIQIMEYLKFHSGVKIKKKRCNRTGRLNLDILMAYLRGRNKSNVLFQFVGADVYMENDSSVTVIYSMGYFFWSRCIICFSYVFLPTLIFCSHISHDIAQPYNLWCVCVYIYIYIYIYIYATEKLRSNLLYYQ